MTSKRTFLSAKSFYFFYYGAGACLFPFLVLYYRRLGFNGSQIGLLASISPLTTLFAASFWSAAADASQRHRIVLLGTMLGAGIAIAALSMVSSFLWLIPIVIAYAFFAAPVIPIVDHSVLARLGEDRALYGRQRLWGAVGWGITAPVAGWLVGRLGIGAAFASYLFFLSLTFLSGLFLPVKKSGRSQPFLSGMRSLLANRGWFLFLLVAFLGGAGSSVTSNYLFLYLEDLKASSTLMGLSLTIATISELPVLFFSNQLLRRWGPRGLMILSLAAYVVRALGYSLAANPGQAVMFQLLHGLTFSAMWVAGVSYANEIAPEGLGATAQGLFSSTVMGLGGITGAFFGGLLLDRYGSAGVFRISAIVVLAGLLVFLYTGRKEISPQRTQGTQRENTK